ncbi:MAG: FHA domain-containing protein [Planctomycetales bacterium]|nr:FHA domain-containing protein [Planctomycetales bacterium]
MESSTPDPVASSPPERPLPSAERRPLPRRILTIGRSRRADIRIRDTALSRKHCQLIPLGDTFLVADLGSRNGTHVNGLPVSKQLLKPGDRIILGGFRLDFLGDAIVIAPADPAEISASEQRAAELRELAPRPAPQGALPEAPAPAPPAAPGLDRFVSYLRGLGADEALLAKALAHVAAPGEPAPAATAEAPSPAAPPAPGAPPVPAAATVPATQAGSTAVLAPPEGMAPAALDAPTVRLPILRLLPATILREAFRRSGAVGVSVVAHAAVLLILVAVLVSTPPREEVPVNVDIQAAGDRFEAAPPDDPEARPDLADADPVETDRSPAPGADVEAGWIGVAGAETRPIAAVEVGEAPAGTGATAMSDRSAGGSLRDRSEVPSLFSVRVGAEREKALRREGGGSPDAEKAVGAALDWLARHQREDGGFPADGLAAACRDHDCGGAGAAGYEAGLTGLALLAFLGRGEGRQGTRHAAVVSRGLAALAGLQEEDGFIGSRKSKGIYNHLLATAAAVEAAGLTGRPQARELARRALRAAEALRGGGGGWRYRKEKADADTAVTSWAGTALAIASRTGLEASPEALGGAVDWIRRTADPSSGRIGYVLPGDAGARLPDLVDRFPPAGAMTAAGALTLLLAGVSSEEPVVAGALGEVGKNLPDARVPDLYAWMWGSAAAFQAGGNEWRDYWNALRKALIPRQKTDGPSAGSFDPDDPWGRTGGRVYATAAAALALEAPYRYARVTGKAAGR